jgi:hypothetical protein
MRAFHLIARDMNPARIAVLDILINYMPPWVNFPSTVLSIKVYVL